MNNHQNLMFTATDIFTNNLKFAHNKELKRLVVINTSKYIKCCFPVRSYT